MMGSEIGFFFTVFTINYFCRKPVSRRLTMSIVSYEQFLALGVMELLTLPDDE